MCNGCAVISLALWFALLVQGVEEIVRERSSSCVEKSFHEAELILYDEFPVIDRQLFDLCPSNVTQLFIKEGLSNTTRLFNGETLSSIRLYHLQDLTIHVENLVIFGSYSPSLRLNHTSVLRSLTIQNSFLSLPILGALFGFHNLVTLTLTNCSLTELPTDILVHSPRLRLIDVSNNRLKYLPFLLESQLNKSRAPTINVTNNPIECNCANSWIYSQGIFIGSPKCVHEMHACRPFFLAHLHSSALEWQKANDSLYLSVFTSRSFTFTCSLNSTLPGDIYWVTPIGVIPPPKAVNSTGYGNYTYYVQPILAPTVIYLHRNSSSRSELIVENARGHLSGEWFCVGRFAVGLSVSPPVTVEVISSIYHAHVYVLSLCYGYGAMAILLLVGIIGGTVRYCSETRCLRRPQPPFAYEGKTFIGVIPVPEVDDESFDEKPSTNETYDINEGSMQYLSACRICKLCMKPPTYWFCSECKAAHFVESVHELKAIDVLHAMRDPPEGDLLQEGEIQLINPPERSAIRNAATPTETASDSPEAHRLLTDNQSEEKNADAVTPLTTPTDATSPYLYVRSGNCVVRVRGVRLTGPETYKSFDDLQSLKNAICFHSLHRPKSADVKLVVSNDKLAEEYREALADLARAVESPDPSHFREHLEEFRNRLRCDVGHGVKVLRGEFQGLRARSAKGVANLRTQSSAAAQRMRAGFSHGVEQVKGGMRSVAELCGASGTIGQTISVVSVYVDETDQVKKERFVSDFVF